jgi:hypothetical protein
MKKNLFRVQVKASFTSVLLCFATVSHSVENGVPITPFGVSNFGAGILPPPSVDLTVALRGAAYGARELRDTNGDRSPVGVRLRVSSAALAVFKTTDIPLLGGTYGFAAMLPYLDLSNRIAVPSAGNGQAVRGTSAAIGDITIVPAMVRWTPSPQLSLNGRIEVQLPTGSYRADRLINTGVNHWTVSPALAFTWVSETGFEVSSNIQLNFNGRNDDTRYRSGVEYQHEFAVGQRLGHWTVGVGGYVYRQISDDELNGAKFRDGNRSRVMALGPAISFIAAGSRWPSISAHAYQEFGARNRTQGTQVAIRAAWSF